ncbi:hypothetical protein LTR17_016837 [Elasticomyces elasticus]|nr:hypothetical protein LTR17_016837 [Elasticomyces elasticus]
MKRKEKNGIELFNIDVRREQLRTKYDADMDHMFSHDNNLTMSRLATTNVVVLRRFSALPADHDLSKIRFEEKSVKDGIYDTIDHGLEWARSRSEFCLAIIAEVTEIEYIPDGQSGTVGFWLPPMQSYAHMKRRKSLEPYSESLSMIKRERRKRRFVGAIDWEKRRMKRGPSQTKTSRISLERGNGGWT